MRTLAIALLLAGCTDESNLGNTYTFRDTRWAVALPGDDQNGAGVSNVKVDHSGNVIAAGDFVGTVDFGATTLTAFANAPHNWVSKRSAVDGSEVWARQIASTESYGSVEFGAIATDADDNVYYAAGYQDDIQLDSVMLSTGGNQNIFVAKLAPDGHVVWATTMPFDAPFQAHTYSMAVTPDGHVYISGYYQEEMKFPNATLTQQHKCWMGEWDCFVAAIAPDGTIAWGVNVPVFGELGVRSDGSIVMTGAPAASMSFAGTTIDLSTDPDLVSARVSTTGKVGNGHTFGVPGVEYRERVKVAVDPTERIATTASYATGATADDTHTSEAALDARGHQLWVGGPVSGQVHENGIAMTATSVLTAGEMVDWTVDFGSGPKTGAMYLAAHDTATGVVTDVRTFAAPGDSSAGAITDLDANADGAIGFTANITRATDFGTGHVIDLPAGSTSAAVIGSLPP